MSTAPLTLPTVEELKAAFPQAVPGLHEPTNKYGYGRLHFKLAGHPFVLRKHPEVAEIDCWLPRYGSAHTTLLCADWVEAVRDSLAYVRAQLVKEAEEAKAAVAALDEAMGTDLKETKT